MRQNEYIFNDCGVCKNPTVFFEALHGKHMKCILSTAQVSEDPGLWDAGYQISYYQGGVYSSPSNVCGFPSEELAKSYALSIALDQYESAAQEDTGIWAKDANRIAESIRRELMKLPSPVKPIVLFNHDTDQFILPL